MTTVSLLTPPNPTTVQDGELVALVHAASSIGMVDQWVRRLAKLTGAQLSWEVVGSIHVKHVGDRASRSRVLHAMCVFASELEAWGLTFVHDEDEHKKMELVDLTKL